MKNIKILYFARFKEKLNYSIEPITLSDEITTVAELKSLLASRGDTWAEVFQQDANVRAAINHQVVADTTSIADGDEVAFFPPVSGG